MKLQSPGCPSNLVSTAFIACSCLSASCYLSSTKAGAACLLLLLLLLHWSGVATTLVGAQQPSSIDIVKRGDTPVGDFNTTDPQDWGYYSAVAFVGDAVWFAVPLALKDTDYGRGSFVFSRWL